MRKHALALCLVLSAALGSAEELLTNPGFEGVYESAAPGWSVNAWGADPPQVRLSREVADAHKGLSSQRVEVTTLPPNSGVILRQEFTFKQGHVYRARLWLRSSDKVRVQVLLRRAGPHYDAGAIRGIETGPQWQEVCIEGGFIDGDVPGFMGLSIKSPGTVIVDSASLVDITDEVLNRATPAERIPASLFGVHINKLGTHNVWPDLGAGVLRLWDTGTCWCHLQPESNRWEWTRSDYYVSHVQRNAPGAIIVLTLGITPWWAAPPDGKHSYSGSSAPPVQMEHWRTYVRTVGQRYRGRIRYWEIWNESDYSGFYTGTVTQMVQMARVAWKELKAIDPDNVVLSPNVTHAGLGWLDEYFSFGGGAFADIISYHCYQPSTPEYAIASYAAVRDVVRSHGLGDKPIWNTEGAVESKTPLSENEAMGSVARAYLVQWAQGIRNFNWYCWDIHWPGGANLSKDLTEAELAPGGIAYRTVVGWLTGAKMVRRTVAVNTWTVELQLADGITAIVAWTTQGEAQVRLPNGWTVAMREDLQGRISAVGAGTAAIGPAPALFHQGNWRLHKNGTGANQAVVGTSLRAAPHR